MSNDKQPIIVGVSQEVWREQEPSRTPVDALQAVATAALSDTGSSATLASVDAIYHVPFILTQQPHLKDAMPVNAGAALAQRLGINAAQYTGNKGGNLPQEFVNAAAENLLSGKHDTVLICGVELLATFLGTVRSGKGFPDWTTGLEDSAEYVYASPDLTAPSEFAHGLFEPINAYPLFESALRHAQGNTVTEHSSQIAALVSRMSAVAAQNPYAWKRQFYAPEAVLDTSGGNRMISHPYTKLMNAIIAVDQAAAVVMTTVGKAKAMGIDPSRWIYLRGAAQAHDTWYLSERPELHRSRALEVIGAAALKQSGLGLEELSFFDLYSCFPSAVQVACNALGISAADPRGVTITGGLTLFGGPGNNYSLHAIAELVARLRADDTGASGLISANGGYLTGHAVGVYSRAPGETPWAPLDYAALQNQVDTVQGPELCDEGSGVFSIEAHTVRCDRDGPVEAIAIGRLADGKRCVAVSDQDALMTRLIENDCVGMTGAVEHVDGKNHFSL